MSLNMSNKIRFNRATNSIILHLYNMKSSFRLRKHSTLTQNSQIYGISFKNATFSTSI